MVMNENGVLQPSAVVFLPAKGDGQIQLTSWGNIDLTSDPGDAWMPDGNGDRFSEIDFIGAYLRRCGDYDVKFGLHNYNFPKGDQFPFGVRGATTEAFAGVSREFSGLTPFAELRYDIDEVDGYYVQAGCEKRFPIADKWTGRVEGYIAYSDGRESEWNYGFHHSSLADARATGQAFYAIPGGPTIDFTLAASTMLNSEMQDWFDSIDIDSTNVWAAVGATWSY
jgi:hypothetical protein